MNRIWPLGTTFTIRIDGDEERLTVVGADQQSNYKLGTISAQSPLGLSLLAALPDTQQRFLLPGGQLQQYEVLAVTLPSSQEAPVQRLADIFASITGNQSISADDESWLKAQGHLQILAHYYDRRYRSSQNINHAISASKYWRQAGYPELALQSTHS